jgi:hypothetical protein
VPGDRADQDEHGRGAEGHDGLGRAPVAHDGCGQRGEQRQERERFIHYRPGSIGGTVC